ncbi:MAG: LolA family protein [Polyangiales bacterium]
MLLAALLGLGVGHGSAAAATSKDSAAYVASQVQSFYDRTKNVSAQFRQVYYHRLYRKKVVSEGRVVFKKPGRMRWDYAKPSGKVITTDGKRIQIYEPGEARQPGQLIEQAMGSHQLPLAFSFLTGGARLEKNFRFRLLNAKKYGFSRGQVLQLRPRKPSPHYDRILFFVEAEGAARGVVRRVMIVDKEGNLNRFRFAKMRFNKKVSDSFFRFKVPRHTRRVRL